MGEKVMAFLDWFFSIIGHRSFTLFVALLVVEELVRGGTIPLAAVPACVAIVLLGIAFGYAQRKHEEEARQKKSED